MRFDNLSHRAGGACGAICGLLIVGSLAHRLYEPLCRSVAGGFKDQGQNLKILFY